MSKFFIAAIAFLLLVALPHKTLLAAVVYDSGTIDLPASAPAQSGELAQTGIPSDWSTPPTFPGVNNASTTFFYDAISLPTSPFAYLQINFLDLSATTNLFASAYFDSYNPDNSKSANGLSVNYLGDEGQTGNLFGNPAAFQVILPNPVSDHLVLVVTDASGAPGGFGQQFSFLVEGFTYTSFNDGTATPEPSSSALLFLALGWAAAVKLRHVFYKRQINSSRS